MQESLLDWYGQKKRGLPWRRVADPYPIWLSEIMLQQTRVETVVSYWTRFLSFFPTVQSLADAPEQAVLKAWEGLGYYSRARNLKRCAERLVAEYGGAFPNTIEALQKLPGIGPYTAGAIASIAFGVPTPAIDGNVERVLSRLLGIREDVGIPSVRRYLFEQAKNLIPKDRPGEFNQALMELGSLVCQPAPKCDQCPVGSFCDACGAGDADALPVKQKKAPQREVARGVALVFYQKKVLLYRRTERLLQGLWCYPGFDGIASGKTFDGIKSCMAVDERKSGEIISEVKSGEAVEKELRALGISARFIQNVGQARHAFTHIIWNMELLHFEADSASCPEGWRWADEKEIALLPLPTAVRAATEVVRQILEK